MFYDRTEKHQDFLIKTYCGNNLDSNKPWCYSIGDSRPLARSLQTISLSEGYVSRESALMAAKEEIDSRWGQHAKTGLGHFSR